MLENVKFVVWCGHDHHKQVEYIVYIFKGLCSRIFGHHTCTSQQMPSKALKISAWGMTPQKKKKKSILDETGGFSFVKFCQ